jgi:hypothetical protein
MIKTSPSSRGLKEKLFELNPYQDKFIFTDARYPALISGWGTGKTMSGIMRGMILSEQIPNNTGLVVRKSFADLKDSTIKDFTRYTGLEVPSNKNVTLPNGSLIMFRHGDELDVLKNINLGWFFMEQAEEFESDEQFQYLRGRLRLAGIPIHTGFVIGNVNGHNWVWELWKKGNDKVRYPLWEATSFDNAKNLPADTIEDWKEMRVTAPSTYNRFVMNDWEAESGVDWLIPISLIEQAETRETTDMNVIKRIISIDPARGGDTVGIMGLENTEIIAEDSFKIMGETKTMEIVGKAMVMREKIKATTFIVDEIGIGAGVKDRLQELKKTTPEIKQVIGVNSGMPSSNPNRYFNVRSEMWWLAGEGFREGKIKSKDLEGNEVFIPMVLKNCSKELKKQLSGVKYEIMDSRGKIRLEPKKDIISRLGHSPDEGDTYVQGIYGLRFAPNLAEPKMTTETQRFWDRVKKERDNIRKRNKEFIDDDLGTL